MRDSLPLSQWCQSRMFSLLIMRSIVTLDCYEIMMLKYIQSIYQIILKRCRNYASYWNNNVGFLVIQWICIDSILQSPDNRDSFPFVSYMKFNFDDFMAWLSRNNFRNIISHYLWDNITRNMLPWHAYIGCRMNMAKSLTIL